MKLGKVYIPVSLPQKAQRLKKQEKKLIIRAGLYQLIPKEQAAQLANKTIIFPHDRERRYIVELDVFHQLHCLVRDSPLL
jgi:hypothetical protein